MVAARAWSGHGPEQAHGWPPVDADGPAGLSGAGRSVRRAVYSPAGNTSCMCVCVCFRLRRCSSGASASAGPTPRPRPGPRWWLLFSWTATMWVWRCARDPAMSPSYTTYVRAVLIVVCVLPLARNAEADNEFVKGKSKLFLFSSVLIGATASFRLLLCDCVCVCVCERCKRGREKEKKNSVMLHLLVFVSLNVIVVDIIPGIITLNVYKLRYLPFSRNKTLRFPGNSLTRRLTDNSLSVRQPENGRKLTKKAREKLKFDV